MRFLRTTRLVIRFVTRPHSSCFRCSILACSILLLGEIQCFGGRRIWEAFAPAVTSELKQRDILSDSPASGSEICKWLKWVGQSLDVKVPIPDQEGKFRRVRIEEADLTQFEKSVEEAFNITALHYLTQPDPGCLQVDRSSPLMEQLVVYAFEGRGNIRGSPSRVFKENSPEEVADSSRCVIS